MEIVNDPNTQPRVGSRDDLLKPVVFQYQAGFRPGFVEKIRELATIPERTGKNFFKW